MIKFTAKRIFALLIVIAMLLSVFACDKGNTGSSNNETSSAETHTKNEESSQSESEPDASGEESTEENTETVACEHPYAASQEGHWKPACNVCGKPEGKVQDHQIYEKIKDQGDRLAYLYLCSVCDYVVFKQELSYDINVYIPPTDLAATRCYNYSGAYYFEDNVGFTRFTSSGSAGIIYAYEDTACEDVSGRYLVMKVRMSGGSSVSLKIKSSMAKSAVSVVPCEIPEEWCTVIIDMAAIGDGKTTGYVPDGGGDYYLSLLDFYLDGNTTLPAGGYIDISYITVVETMEDARDFASKNDVLYIYSNVMMNPFPTIEGASCLHNYTYDNATHSMSACEKCGAQEIVDASHNITERVHSGVYAYSCECGYTYDTSKTVSSAVNTFLSPSYIAKHADSAACWSGGELMFENGGEPFARIYGKEKDAAGRKITDDKKVWNVYSNGIAVTGQYLVIKYRVPDNDLKYVGDGTSPHTQSQIRIYTSTQRNGATDEKDGFYLPVSEDNKWHVAIINLAFSVGNSSGSTYTMAEDGTYTMKFLQMRLFYGGLSSENDYTDIAYIGFCDKLEEAVSLVQEDEYYWQCKKGERVGYTVKKSEGPNPEDEIPETETEPETEPIIEHVIIETVKDGVYSYSCSHCNKEIDSLTVSSEVNKFYSPKHLSTLTGYNAVTSMGIDSDGTLYTRITGKGGSAFEYEFVNRQGSPATDAGAFRYLVFRIRVSNAAKHLNAVFEMEKSSVSVRLNNSMISGEWMTVVLDMNALSKIVANSDGSYKIKHFRLYPQDLGADYVDISYVAMCDDWSEVAPLCVEEKVTVVTHESNPGGKVNSADGSCASHVPSEAVFGEIYTYKCSSCGETIFEKTVPSATNLFIAPTALGSAYGFTSQLTTEDGIVFKRFTSAGQSGHIYIRDSATLADAGKLLVIKIRVGEGMSSFVAEAGADKLSTVEQNPPKNKGVWRTVVLDLSQFATYSVDAENGKVWLRFTLYGNNAGFTIDIAYVAIVDSREEARAIIDDETYEFYTNWKNTPVIVNKDQPTCDTCVTAETVNGSTYSYSECAVCGRTFEDATKTVSSDITKYYSASMLASGKGYNSNRILLADGSGEAFARVTSTDGGAHHFYIVDLNGSPATDLGEPARYVMFKVRMSNPLNEYTFSLSANGGGAAALALHPSVTKKDEWVTIVADMDTISKLMPDGNGNYTLKKFYMYTSATGSDTFDIACVAFCNTWEEIASASGSDKAMLMTVNNTKGTLVSTADGSEITE